MAKSKGQYTKDKFFSLDVSMIENIKKIEKIKNTQPFPPSAPEMTNVKNS